MNSNVLNNENLNTGVLAESFSGTEFYADQLSAGNDFAKTPAAEPKKTGTTTEKRRLTKSERTRRREKTVSFIVLFIVCVLFLIPLLYMIGTSFKSDLDLQLHPEKLFPSAWSEWTLKHYEGFIVREGKIDNMPVWMFNSLWSTLATVLLTVIVDLITAYAFVFLKFRIKNSLLRFLILWMAIPGVIGSAPSFAIYSSIRNSLSIQSDFGTYAYIYMWLVIPGITGIFNLLLMRNFFVSIPKDIIDSAKTDGASHATIFFKIVVPLAKSTIMLIVLFTFTGSWNSLTWPQLLLSGEKSYWNTVTVALTGYTGGSAASTMGIQMATSVFALIPIVIIFIITQNKMIDGLASSGIKG